jgi:N-acetyl sugar amidotransferase
MDFCKKCLMPTTKPGLQLDESGVCGACNHAERKKTTDWGKRHKELEELCEKYRGKNGNYYDCLIAVSGGKDSHYQVHVMKEQMGMNPLLVSVDNFSWTDVGRQNFANINEAFGCDVLVLSLNKALAKKMARKGFEHNLVPNWYWDMAVYAYPIRMGINMNIPLIMYGENVSVEYGGVQTEETPSAMSQINNNVVTPIDWNVWCTDGVTMKDLNTCIYPTMDEIKSAKLEPVYLSYYHNWDGGKNYELAKEKGFRPLGDEWKREGFIEDYDQIDAIGYLVHPWFKYAKFGFFRATDVTGYWVRSGKIDKKEALNLIEEHDHKLDKRALEDFLSFTGYSESEFWSVVDRFWNKDIFENKDGQWVLKEEIRELRRKRAME